MANRIIAERCSRKMIKEQNLNRSRQSYFPKPAWLIVFYHCFRKEDSGLHKNTIAISGYYFWRENYCSHYSFICILLLVMPLGSLSPSGNKQMLFPILISSSFSHPLVQQSCKDQSWVSVMNGCIFSLRACHPDKVFWHFPPWCSDMRDLSEFLSSPGNFDHKLD